MKSTNFNKELKSKSLADLVELERTMERDLWKTRFDNFSAKLDDTDKIRRTRRDVARVKTAITAKKSAK